MAIGRTNRVEGLVAVASYANRSLSRALIVRLAAAGFEGLTAGSATILPLIGPEGARPIVLAERSGLTRQAVGQVLRELESRGFVQLLPDPTDTRAKIVRFVGAGHALHDAAVAANAGIEAQAAKIIGARDGAWLESALRDIAVGLDPDILPA